MPASAATARIVVRSYPCAANRSRAAFRIADLVRSERFSGAASAVIKVMPTTVGQQVLTLLYNASIIGQRALANIRWPTDVDPDESTRRRSQMTTSALPTHTEVAIVGAGPTGLALAVTLASAGIEFVIVDQLAEGANTSRAAVVHARTLEVLNELGAADALIARGDQVNRFAVRDGSRRLLTLPFDGLPTPYPYTLMVPQCDTEAVLLARLRALGRDVHRPYQVSSVVQDEDGVTLTMSTGQTLRAGHAVGADGMHSAVREAAGIGFTGSAYGESFVLADVTMDWTPGPEEV